MEDRFAGKVIIPTMPETFQEWLARAFGFYLRTTNISVASCRLY